MGLFVYVWKFLPISGPSGTFMPNNISWLKTGSYLLDSPVFQENAKGDSKFLCNSSICLRQQTNNCRSKMYKSAQSEEPFRWVVIRQAPDKKQQVQEDLNNLRFLCSYHPMPAGYRREVRKKLSNACPCDGSCV
jgi:hypothetical protein